MQAAALHALLEACARGVLAPSLTAMRLILAGAGGADLEPSGVLEGLEPRERSAGRKRLERLQRLLAGPDTKVERVRHVAAAVPHTAGTPVEAWARHFDAAVRLSPEASVALYSLGDPQLLQEATSEIVALLARWGLLSRARTVLDVGCGIGRLCVALAPHVAGVLGLDISAGMLAAARTRCAGHAGIRLRRGSATDLDGVPQSSVDLVLAVDCLPYVQLSDRSYATRFLARSAHVLRPRGDLVVFNWSYGHAPAEDAADFARQALAAGLEPLGTGSRPLYAWDGQVFHARAPSAAPAAARDT